MAPNPVVSPPTCLRRRRRQYGGRRHDVATGSRHSSRSIAAKPR
jgi:hypothetical protein